MFIPLRDESPTRITPFINYSLILANTAIFLYEITLPHRDQAALAMVYGSVPVRVAHLLGGRGHFDAALIPLFTSIFLHAGFAHLLGNMLFLWIFGDNVEEFFGHVGYLAFYLFCGVASGLASCPLQPSLRGPRSGCKRRHLRRHGCLHSSLPPRANPDARAYLCCAAAGLHYFGLLVFFAIRGRDQFIRRNGNRRSRMVGTHRWFSNGITDRRIRETREMRALLLADAEKS